MSHRAPEDSDDDLQIVEIVHAPTLSPSPPLVTSSTNRRPPSTSFQITSVSSATNNNAPQNTQNAQYDDDLMIVNVETRPQPPPPPPRATADDDEIQITDTVRHAPPPIISRPAAALGPNNNTPAGMINSTSILRHVHNLFFPNNAPGAFVTGSPSVAIHLPDGEVHYINSHPTPAQQQQQQLLRQRERLQQFQRAQAEANQHLQHLHHHHHHHHHSGGGSPAPSREDVNRAMEQRQLLMAQLLSSEHYARRLQNTGPTLDSIKKLLPPPPSPAGYTRSVTTGKRYVCQLCACELTVGFPLVEEGKDTGPARYRGLNDVDRALSQRLFFATCGHVYCGWCVHRIANRKSLKQNVRPRRAPARGSQTNSAASQTQSASKRRKAGAAGSVVVVESGADAGNDDDGVERLTQMYIPASCTAEHCKKQFRSKTFTEIYL